MALILATPGQEPGDAPKITPQATAENATAGAEENPTNEKKED